MEDNVFVTIGVGIATIVVIVVLFVISLLTGFFGKLWNTEVDNFVFKNSTAYTEATASFIAESYQQYMDTDDEAEKDAIMNYVILKYPNIDTNNISNDTLREFYDYCLVGGE